MLDVIPHTDLILIETLPALRVACYRAISHTPEQDAEQFLSGWLSAQAIDTPTRWFGFAFEVPAEQQKQGQRGYEAWVTVPERIGATDGVTLRAFRGGTYATLMLNQPFANAPGRIAAGWKRLHQWVIESACCRSANHQWLEEVIPQTGSCELKLYHPILVYATGIQSALPRPIVFNGIYSQIGETTN